MHPSTALLARTTHHCYKNNTINHQIQEIKSKIFMNNDIDKKFIDGWIAWIKTANNGDKSINGKIFRLWCNRFLSKIFELGQNRTISSQTRAFSLSYKWCLFLLFFLIMGWFVFLKCPSKNFLVLPKILHILTANLWYMHYSFAISQRDLTCCKSSHSHRWLEIF